MAQSVRARVCRDDQFVSVEHPGFDPRCGSSQCYIFLALGCSLPRSCGDCVHFGAYIQCSGVGFDVLSSDGSIRHEGSLHSSHAMPPQPVEQIMSKGDLGRQTKVEIDCVGGKTNKKLRKNTLKNKKMGEA